MRYKDLLPHQWHALLKLLNWQDRLSAIVTAMAGNTDGMIFSTSFGVEDQVLTHLIASEKLPIKLFTLDTGRLFEETYQTYAATTAAYPNIAIQSFFPTTENIEVMVEEDGINGFYQSVAARRKCCFIRKVEPLNRALTGAKIWISGLRQEQSINRQDKPFAEVDVERGLVKIYPLLDVTTEQLWQFVTEHNVPVNALHEQGFPSIGCAPCTRAVEPGEDSRAGRWWWEQDNSQECGLHVSADGTLTRAKVRESAHV